MADFASTPEIDHLRSSLSEKLEELHRRATEARETLQPFTNLRHLSKLALLGDRRVQAGLGAVAGIYVLSRASGESLPRTALRAALAIAGAVGVFRALTPPAPTDELSAVCGELDAIPVPYSTDTLTKGSSAYISLDIDKPAAS